MLDKRTMQILSQINKECTSGSFQVVEIDDLINVLPRKYMVDKNVISQSISALERDGFIDVKYHDSEVYCLCPLPKGRLLFENKVEERQQSKKIKRLILLVLGLFFVLTIVSSMLGCFLYRFIAG